MTRKKKVLIILHLCFAFSYLFWLGTQPFVRQVTATKASTLLFTSVTNSPRFEKLPESKQLELLKGQESLKKGTFRPLITKYRFPATGLIWAVLSILVCFFLLFYIEGAHLAAWLLPVAVIVYAFSLSRAPPLKGESIFPPEEVITSQYIQPDEIFKKKQDKLVEAWNRYLITDWAHQIPSEETALRAEQLEEGVFNFNIERATWVLNKRGEDAVVAHLLFHPPFVLIIAYLTWNSLFAWRINRYTKLEARSHESAKVPA